MNDLRTRFATAWERLIAVQARDAAEKLRQQIAAHHFDQCGQLTVSFGVAAFEPRDDLNSLLKRVDDALYRAKVLGRNRVECLSSGS